MLDSPNPYYPPGFDEKDLDIEDKCGYCGSDTGHVCTCGNEMTEATCRKFYGNCPECAYKANK